MKKTLITLLTLSGVAMAEPVTLPVTTDLTVTTSTTNLSGFGAFDFKVSDNSKFQSSQEIDYSTVTGILLNKIDLSVYNTWYTNRHCDVGFGAGVFQKEDNGTWTLLGKTDWWKTTTTAYTGTVTLSPTSEIMLEIGKTCTIAFFAGKDYFDGLEVGDTRSTMTEMGEWKNSTVPVNTSTLAAVGIRGQDAGGSNGILMYGNGTTLTQYLPNVGLNVTLVPEPATATLSLLALAGLATRRRRK